MVDMMKGTKAVNPGDLDNAALAAGVRRLASDGRRNEVELLRYIGEVGARKLYLDAGYSSLYTYCLGELKGSESSAWRFAMSAHVVREYPEIEALLLSGSIHSTAVSMIASHLKDKDPVVAAERIQLACGKTKREIDVMVAGWSDKPVAAVKDSIRILPGKDTAGCSTDQALGLKFPDEPQAVNAGKQQSVVDNTQPVGTPPAETSRPPTPQPEAPAKAPIRILVKFEADGQLAELIERAKEVTAHLPEGESLASLFKASLEALLDHRDPIRKAKHSRPRQAAKAPKAARNKKSGQRAKAGSNHNAGQSQKTGQNSNAGSNNSAGQATKAEPASAPPQTTSLRLNMAKQRGSNHSM